jgi:Fic family protein
LDEIDKLYKEIAALQPLSESLQKQLRAYYRIGLTYASNALEGNSLTETETKVLLEDGLTVGGKPMRDHFEAIGHGEAYDYMHSLVGTKLIAEADIKEMHRLFYRHIDAREAGEYRKQKVFISGSRFIPPSPEEVPALMRALEERWARLRRENHPVVFAALAHKEFVFIHPFIDGNGRVARLLMNLALIQEGFPVAVIPPVLRVEYINALERAHGDEQGFVEFIAERVKETLREYLRMVG